MPPILNAQGLSKTFGATTLFRNVSFTVSERDAIGLIGPNGAGKSTLLRILSGMIAPDEGEVTWRKLTRISYVEQESEFAPDDTVRTVLARALERAGIAESERAGLAAETLGRAGFEEFDAEASSLSGGWRKRLAIAEALVVRPDILLLDEPTNHLDLLAIEWLESLLQNAPFATVVVTHDRYFLENVARQMTELNRSYAAGMLRVDGNYTRFLEAKQEALRAQARRQEALENRVRREIEWLRRGPKARTSKSKARIDRAGELISELADLSARSRTASAQIDLAATERRSKRLVEVESLACTIAGRKLFEALDLTITAGMHVGLVGPNGSGKTSFLRLLKGELEPSAGTVRRAEHLRVVHFDQDRFLDPQLTVARALAPDSDAVVYQERVIHVASWAARFLFAGEQLRQPVARLSGGERARVLIARLMLQPADLLLLDEPTNDLDIETLEILEENLLEYRGALVMVTHDRYLLDRVSTVVLGLDGRGGTGIFADYRQWEAWLGDRANATTASGDGSAERRRGTAPATEDARQAEPRTAGRKKLSYLDAREYAFIEERIAGAEATLAEKRLRLEDPAIASDSAGLLAAQAALEEAQRTVDELYARWAELEEKQTRLLEE